jgi:hypothetical protein
MGFRTIQRRTHGGRALGKSSLYFILTNPFYAGQFVRRGKVYAGKHKAMVSLQEFARVQKLLGRDDRSRPQTSLDFSFRGCLTCGECGASVTAERKVNRYGRQYTYYHCTHNKRGTLCRQPSVQEQSARYPVSSVP